MGHTGDETDQPKASDAATVMACMAPAVTNTFLNRFLKLVAAVHHRIGLDHPLGTLCLHMAHFFVTVAASALAAVTTLAHLVAAIDF